MEVLTDASTRTYFGAGAFEKVEEAVSVFKAKKILLVLGERHFRNSRFYLTLKTLLSQYELEEASPVTVNPRIDFIDRLLKLLKSRTFHLVLGIGGGSVMDVAKICALCLVQPTARVRVLEVEPLPLIAIPTTAGTGSEVTPFVSYENDQGQKVTLDHPRCLPKLAFDAA